MNSARSAREMREPTRSPDLVAVRTLTLPDPGVSLGAVTATMVQSRSEPRMASPTAADSLTMGRVAGSSLNRAKLALRNARSRGLRGIKMLGPQL